MPRDIIDRSKDWSFVPRALAVRGLSDDLVRRVSRWEPDDPVRTIAEVLVWAAELVPQGLRVPVLERFVRSTRILGEGSQEIEQRLRAQALSPTWRAAAAEELRALASAVAEAPEPESVEPASRNAYLLAHWVLRQSHGLGLLAAAERDPDSLHSALPPEDRARVRDLILGGSLALLDDTVARWNGFVVELGRWGYDEYANFLSTRDMLSAAEATVRPDTAVILRASYTAIDRAYIEQTQPIGHAIHDGPGRWSPRGWWYYRAPRNPDAAFARSAGLQVAGAQSSERAR